MNTYIQAIIRHAIAGLGVWMVNKGYADESTATAIVGGVVAAAGLAWSLVEKKIRDKKESRLVLG